MSTNKLNSEYTTIKVRIATRKRLGKLGDLEDTFDSVVCKLIDEYEANQQTKRSKK